MKRGHPRHFGQSQPGIAQIPLHGIGLGGGGVSTQGTLAGPRVLLRELHHPAATVAGTPHAAGTVIVPGI